MKVPIAASTSAVVVPEGVLEVALQQQLVIGVGQSHQQRGIPIADVS